jgi:tetratricopeptide (TPR) repeat protein
MERRFAPLAYALAVAACAALASPEQRYAYDVQQGMKAMEAHRADAAARWFDDAHAVSRAFGEHDPRRAQAMNMLAWTYHARGQFGWALLLHGAALDAQKKALGPSHPDVVRIRVTRAETYAEMGNWEEAEADFAQAAAIFDAALGPDDRETRNTRGAISSRCSAGRSQGPERAAATPGAFQMRG